MSYISSGSQALLSVSQGRQKRLPLLSSTLKRHAAGPSSRYRYFHKLSALNVELPDLKRPTRPALEEAMRGYVLAEPQLLGTYQNEL